MDCPQNYKCNENQRYIMKHSHRDSSIKINSTESYFINIDDQRREILEIFEKDSEIYNDSESSGDENLSQSQESFSDLQNKHNLCTFASQTATKSMKTLKNEQKFASGLQTIKETEDSSHGRSIFEGFNSRLDTQQIEENEIQEDSKLQINLPKGFQTFTLLKNITDSINLTKFRRIAQIGQDSLPKMSNYSIFQLKKIDETSIKLQKGVQRQQFVKEGPNFNFSLDKSRNDALLFLDSKLKQSKSLVQSLKQENTLLKKQLEFKDTVIQKMKSELSKSHGLK